MSVSAEQFVRDYVGAMNSHDVAAVTRFFADDASYEDAAIGTVRQGPAAVAEFITFFFHCYENVHYTVSGVTGGGDRIAWEWTLDCNYSRTSHTGIPATGQKVSVRGASFMRLRDGKASWNTDYWDIGTMRRQIEGGGAPAAH